jgi:hypothetical protein
VADTPSTAPAVVLAAVDSGAPKLLPIDQADPSFRAFRDSLIAALARKDTTFLYGVLAQEIKNSFGGDDSIAGFKRIWRMDEPQPSEVWTVLARILRMGAEKQGDYMTTPYVFAIWPDSIDAFEHVAVVKENAPVYGTPDRSSPPIGSASYSILKRVSDDMDWYELELPGGRKVWLRGEDVYSPVDWRAMFERRGGRWTMVYFVAGD